MFGLIVTMLVMLAVTGFFLVKPLMADETAAGSVAADDADASAVQLTPEEKRLAVDELQWRLDHDLETGRIDAEEHARLSSLAEEAGRAGRSKRSK